MKSMKSTTPSLDFRICGDKLEQDRIELEQNLLHTDLSLHLSDTDDGSSVEYPRHNSGPHPFHNFDSFEPHACGYPERDSYGFLHHSFYRDDDGGINPYAGETVSTAAHHASALTLSAGLAGRAGRNISSSVAEYDPDRPLQDIIIGTNDKLHLLDDDPSKVDYNAPLIIDSTAQLDRVLLSGHAILPGSQPIQHCPPSNSSTSSELDVSSRPRLSEALRRVSFSPQRPRSAHSYQSQPHRRRRPGTVDSRHSPSHPVSLRQDSTPKPRDAFPVRQHPTQFASGSHSSRMATFSPGEIAAEIDVGNGGGDQARNPFRDIINKHSSGLGLHKITPRRSSIKSPRRKPNVQLPDVTGLTNAVESPDKPLQRHYAYRSDDPLLETETRLFSTLNAIQSKLLHLESENAISRRRVHELELELKACKVEVKRERTRVSAEDVIAQQRQLADTNAPRRSKSMVHEGDQSRTERYNEVVEEKTALEALIATLRAHLTRLTVELSSQRQLLTELRSLRESDRRVLKKKSVEVERLRVEVERLAGEVEVLRAVVEEGLKERRVVREHHSRSHDATPERTPHENEEQRKAADEVRDHGGEVLISESEDLEYTSRNLDAAGLPDRTVQVDGARSPSLTPTTLGLLVDERKPQPVPSLPQPYPPHSLSRPPSGPRSCSPSLVQQRRRLDDGRTNHSNGVESAKIVTANRGACATFIQPLHRAKSSLSPPTTPLPIHPRGSPCSIPKESDTVKEAPFPRIRGTHLERLFFSIPEHNSKTCTICRRRYRPGLSSVRQPWPPWLGKRKIGHTAADGEDEGFVEGPEDSHGHTPVPSLHTKRKEKHDQSGLTGRVHNWKTNDGRKCLPPQTVLARVLRELEDDFAHYKSIYVELADEYKILDAVSDVPKRKLVAHHLRDVIDVLEQKGDQISSLYNLLTFKDQPYPAPSAFSNAVDSGS